MRVLFFGKFPIARHGGIERHVQTLTEGLAARGVAVTNLVYGDTSRQESRVRGVRIIESPVAGMLGSQPVSWAMVREARRLIAEGVDLIHLHFPDPFAHGVASLVAGRIPVVVSWHSDIVRQRVVGAAYRQLARLVLRRPAAVLVATARHADSRQLDLIAPRERVHVVPYGIDAARFVPDAAVLARATVLRAAYGPRPLVFALGRHVGYKGFDVLIDAVAKSGAQLVLGGDGPLTPSLRDRVANSGAASRLHVIGEIPESDLVAWHHASDMFCLSSVAPAEAFGLVQAEAMACGRPVINTALGNGVNEVSPDGVSGLTVPVGDVDALATAIDTLGADPVLRRRLGEAGRERVKTRYSIPAMVDGTLAVYRHVANRGT
jgi:rhamnosyl/mannosyltransferase